MTRKPSEYRQQVIEMYRRGIPAREIAKELGRTTQAINSCVNDARKAGQLPQDDPEKARLRRRLNQLRAIRRGLPGSDL